MAILKSTFLKYGTLAPPNSNFKGVIDTNSIFGEKGLFKYHKRESAIKKSGDSKKDYSFFDYTQRAYAVNSSERKEIYYTYSDNGFLTDKKEKEWLREAKESFSKKGNLLFQEMLSFENYEEAKSYGLNSQSDFATLMDKCMPKIAKAIGMNYTNLMWWMDYHTNTKHPHIHFNFFEKEQTLTKGKIDKRKLDRVKRIIYTELYDRKRTLEQRSSLEFKQEIDLRKKEILDSISIKNKHLNYMTINKIFNLYIRLEDTGRLQFHSIHQKDKRKELLEISEMILKDTVGKEDYQNFLKLLKDNDKALNSVAKENVFNNALTNLYDLKIKIANMVLKAYKDDETKEAIGMNHTNSKKDDLMNDYNVQKIKKRREKYLSENGFSNNVKGKNYVLNKSEKSSFAFRLNSQFRKNVDPEIRQYLSNSKSEINAYLRNTDELVNVVDDFEIIQSL
ncbi:MULTISPECIES: relaxase MobL [Terrabacteria group]|uniref:relaxase MobL n=1 Tax=Bacillati TaxID=1783272 RepID=UPI001C6E7BD7|nr:MULTISPECIES: relaxase MobL [Terrabacteria group]MBW9213118.1 relaxase MobL [Trueperella sp. zg.1013]